MTALSKSHPLFICQVFVAYQIYFLLIFGHIFCLSHIFFCQILLITHLKKTFCHKKITMFIVSLIFIVTKLVSSCTMETFIILNKCSNEQVLRQQYSLWNSNYSQSLVPVSAWQYTSLQLLIVTCMIWWSRDKLTKIQTCLPWDIHLYQTVNLWLCRTVKLLPHQLLENIGNLKVLDKLIF